MTFQKLASLVAKKEGKKSQVHIGNIREVLKVTFDTLLEIPGNELFKFWQSELTKRQKKMKK